MDVIEVLIYTMITGKQPLFLWHEKLETKTQVVVDARIARMRRGNLGDCKKIQGADIWELRIDYGPGYRIYFGRQGSTIVVLLVGGDKGSQSRDIAKAQEYWLDYKNRGKK